MTKILTIFIIGILSRIGSANGCGIFGYDPLMICPNFNGDLQKYSSNMTGAVNSVLDSISSDMWPLD